MDSTINTAKNAILLATYNGEKYLPRQLDSILAQDFSDWHTFIHDDGSRDNTLSILKEYSERFPNKITVLNYPSRRGACANFLSLLERVDAEYYWFCDQDDIWYSDKLRKTHSSLLQLESAYPDCPIVTYCDLRVVDERGHVIHPSFRTMRRIDPNLFSKPQDYIFNIVTGCSMNFNRIARDLALSGPYYKARMHDSWVALYTVFHGGIVYPMEEVLIDYRQHDSNVLGVKDARLYTLSYCICHIRQMLIANWNNYSEVRNAGYPGSLFTYILHKI